MCTGVLVNRETLVTAAHCGAVIGSVVNVVGDGKSIGRIASGIERHPELDLVLLHLNKRVAQSVSFFAMLEAAGSEGLVGRSADIAGRGLDGTSPKAGDLLFASVLIEKADDNIILVRGNIDGTGACFGDSGGPLLDRDSLGRVRLLGLLYEGSTTCTGVDSFVPASSIAKWLQELNVPFEQPSKSCAGLSAGGFCANEEAVTCDEGNVKAERCAEDEVCTWNFPKRSQGCVARSEDPCAGQTEGGSCSGKILTRCVMGVRTSTDCGACSLSCERLGKTAAFACQ